MLTSVKARDLRGISVFLPDARNSGLSVAVTAYSGSERHVIGHRSGYACCYGAVQCQNITFNCAYYIGPIFENLVQQENGGTGHFCIRLRKGHAYLSGYDSTEEKAAGPNTGPGAGYIRG